MEEDKIMNDVDEATPGKLGKMDAIAKGAGYLTAGVGAAISASSNSGRFDNRMATGNVVSTVGGGVASGASLGTAILPGIGTAVGAIIGGGLGAITSSIENKKLRREQALRDRRENLARSLSSHNFNNMALRNQYAEENIMDYTMPGFRYGKAPSGMAGNAMVSKGEGIRDGYTGSIGNVPGRYDKNNPDTVPFFVDPAMSIYSADPKTSIPGGKSTPADIIARMAPHQKKNRDILSGKTKSSSIDKTTAELNNRYIDGVTENLDKYTLLSKAGAMWKIGRYNVGKSPYEDYIKSMRNQRAFNQIGRVGMEIASLAPIVYNMSNSIPEVAVPRMYSYTNPTVRADIATPMREQSRQAQVSRYNFRNSYSNTGANMAYSAANYASNVDNLSRIYSMANEQNNRMRMAESEMHNNYQKANQDLLMRYDDINAQNRAAARKFKAEGFGQINEYAQVKLQDRKQRDNDSMMYNMWLDEMGDKISPEKRSLYGELGKGMGLNILPFGANGSVANPQNLTAPDPGLTPEGRMLREELNRKTDDRIKSSYGYQTPIERLADVTTTKAKADQNLWNKGAGATLDAIDRSRYAKTALNGGAFSDNKIPASFDEDLTSGDMSVYEYDGMQLVVPMKVKLSNGLNKRFKTAKEAAEWAVKNGQYAMFEDKKTASEFVKGGWKAYKTSDAYKSNKKK